MFVKRLVITVIGILVLTTHLSIAQEEKKVTFSGKVVDSSGQLLTGAKVSFYQIVYEELGSYYKSKLLGEISTRANGAFSFDMDASQSYRNGIILAAEHGFSIGWANWQMRENKERDIVLGKPEKLEGIIVDEDKSPLSDVTIYIAMGVIGEDSEQQTLSAPVTRDLITTKTDSAGRFKFNDLPAQATFELGAEKPGYATILSWDMSRRSGEKMQFSTGQTDIELEMPREARIDGMVIVRETGEKVEGATIIVRGERMMGYFQRKSVISQTDGSFMIDALQPSSYTLNLVMPHSELAEWVAEPVSVTLEKGKTKQDVRIEACKGGILEISIKDEESEMPIEGASVSIRDIRNNQWINGTSNNKGIARIRMMPAAYQLNSIYMQGYQRLSLQENFTIEDGTTKRQEYKLTGQPKVSGIVKDENDEPIEGVKLFVLPSRRDKVVSDSEGKYEIIWDPAFWGERDTAFFLVAQDEKRNLALAVEVDEKTKNLDITLEPGITLTGKVVDLNGESISDARIRTMLRGPGWGSPISDKEVKADNEGNYEVTALPCRSVYNVYANADGYGQKDVRVDTADAVDNRLEIETMELPLANLSISGQIVDIDNNPIANARIHGNGEGQPQRCETQTDSEGNFILDSVCAGTIRLWVDVRRGERRLSANAVTEGGAKDIKIVIREGRSVTQYFGSKTYDEKIKADKIIAGVAVDENGTPVADVPVGVECIKRKTDDGRYRWTYSNYQTLRDTTDKLGRFAIELEENAQYNLLFSPDNQAAIMIYDIPTGKKGLKVVLPEGGTVTGRLVRLEKGEKVPVPNAEVKIEQVSRASYSHLGFDRDKTTITDSQGEFRFEHIRTKIRPSGNMSDEEWDYIPRVWNVSYGDTIESITFHDEQKLMEIELVIKSDSDRPQTLVDSALPDFYGIKIDLTPNHIKGKKVLLSFFDMNQRPSRHCLSQLKNQLQELQEKDVSVIAVQAAKVEQEDFNSWVENLETGFPIGIIQADLEATKSRWNIGALPWLILTDKSHTVIAEGFSVSEIGDKLE